MHRMPPVYDQTGPHCGAELLLYKEDQGTFENEATRLSAAQSLVDAYWALPANHGALVVGKDLRQTHLRFVTLEWRSKRVHEIKLAGGGMPLRDEQSAFPRKTAFPYAGRPWPGASCAPTHYTR